ncbi:MAG TPA: hypothetical protein VN999_02060 [Thermoanaerobaculia bacterium]|nr:hypothetical protein [Thermoanaerobaculia bacterium]
MRVSTVELATSPHPDHRLPLAGNARSAAGLAPDTGGRRDQDRPRRSGLPHAPHAPNAPKLHRIRQATRTVLTALLAWSGEKYGIDPVYLGVLLLASFQLGVQRLLGR